MGKKGGKKGKGGGKSKGPDFDVTAETCAYFGVGFRDIIRTPLGLEGVVIGVKKTDAEDKSTWRLWLEVFIP